MKPLHICIDARSSYGSHGGVEQFIIGVASGLSKLSDGDEEYFFLSDSPETGEWIEPFLQGPCRSLFCSSRPTQKTIKFDSIKPFVQDVWNTIRSSIQQKSIKRQRSVKIPRSDGTIEKVGIDLMHFTTQKAFLTEVPSIYHPHDLQHLHLPYLFEPRTYQVREIRYRAFCEQARMVAVESTWIKDDIVKQYGVPDGKIAIVPLAPPVAAYPVPSDSDFTEVIAKYALPHPFAFYPAQTWAHKNHMGIIEALAILRDQHKIIVPFVFSGNLNKFFANIEKRVRDLDLTDQVHFLGFVSPLELQCLYKLCRCVIIPSKFEAGSFPLLESFYNNAPAACSNVTSLPAQAGGAAIIFDPDIFADIANAVKQLWCDDELCKRLVEKGRQRVTEFTWERSVRMFRAHYRKLTGRNLTKEDQSLLSAPPML
jgi:glycosyltransferase involved in cell wall biosynthesis